MFPQVYVPIDLCSHSCIVPITSYTRPSHVSAEVRRDAPWCVVIGAGEQGRDGNKTGAVSRSG